MLNETEQYGSLVEVEVGKAPAAPTAPSMAGYTFVGWNTDPTATTGVTTLPAVNTVDGAILEFKPLQGDVNIDGYLNLKDLVRYKKYLVEYTYKLCSTVLAVSFSDLYYAEQLALEVEPLKIRNVAKTVYFGKTFGKPTRNVYKIFLPWASFIGKIVLILFAL
jgi:uncharacterized repeat protein (TIGR02543 family)